MSELGPVDKVMSQDDDSDEITDYEHEDDLEQLPGLKSLCEAITCLGDICDFLKTRGYTSEANNSSGLLDNLAKLHCTSQTKQTPITHYFSCHQNT